eukprot:5245914-Prymnesium_polylepis.1
MPGASTPIGDRHGLGCRLFCDGQATACCSAVAVSSARVRPSRERIERMARPAAARGVVGVKPEANARHARLSASRIALVAQPSINKALEALLLDLLSADVRQRESHGLRIRL